MPAPLDTHQEIVAGDDYMAADGRALVWGPSQYWPNLSGATLSLIVGHNEFSITSTLPLTWTAVIPLSEGENGQPGPPVTLASLDVTGADSLNMPPAEYDYLLNATLLDGDTIALAAGKLTVLGAPGTTPLFPPAI